MSNKNKPIAIVGIGCRFPGLSSSPEKFWEMLINKTDAIVDVPLERWDNRRFYDDNDIKAGKIRAKQGGFLKEKIDEFDPLFFGISPREAESLDPQERLLLEVAYEAMEDAGMTLTEFKGSKTGVFVGGFTFDNYILQTSKDNREIINSHTATGVTLTMLSNRLSYTYDLKGPSITIDTACSSSLVATHYACQSIWNGESSMALVGGVNVIIKPENSILMSKGKFLSKHSRCKAFDSDAGGYVRGEGAGIVILKPLDEAIKNNDRIYALIEGTGVNQDGRTNGITVPNGNSQKELIQKIYADCNINAENIHYVEAHGTGTPVGDPIEFKALNDALSVNRNITTNKKCLIGSVKTNIGHLEGGAGVAGLIKATLCLYKNAVPPNLHFKNPNPALNYEDSILKVPTVVESLPQNEESYASINSFGYGGTNAHVVIKQFNPVKKEINRISKEEKPFLFPISAKSQKSLKELAKKYQYHIENNSKNFKQILSNLVYKRTHHSDRLVIYASNQKELVEKLDAYEEDILLKGVTEGITSVEKNKIVFVYTGMGPQWWKMGRELMESEPVFFDMLVKCDDYFKTISGWSILEELKKPEEISKIKETYIAQPANLIIQVGLTKLLEHYGVVPDAVVGHSVGEVASAYISGALSLKEALEVSYHRSRLQHTTAGKGVMLAVGIPEEEIVKTIKSYNDVSVAAVNSPNSVTLSGNKEALESIASKYESEGVFNKLLAVNVPYHSPVMSLIKDELIDSLKNIKGKKSQIDLYSTVTGDKIPGEKIDKDYWWQNVRKPVYFAKAINSIARDSYNIFIEVGPHPVLKNSIFECLKNNQNYHFLQTLNRKESDLTNFFENLSSLHTLGHPLRWDRWIQELPHIKLPSYPWQKERFWIESQASKDDRMGRSGNVFLNNKVNSPNLIYEVELNKYFFPFLNDHMVHGKVVFPGAAYIAAGIALYQHEINKNSSFRLENIEFHQVLTIESDKVQKIYSSFNSKNNQYNILSKNEGENASWFSRSTGKFVIGKFENNPPVINFDSILPHLNTKLNEEEVYERLSQIKLEYGPYFRGIKSVHIGGRQLLAKIKAHKDISSTDHGYLIHPALLDSCFQAMITFVTSEFIPVSVGKIHCYASPKDEFLCYAKLKFLSEKTSIADLFICDEQGKVAIHIEDFKCQEFASSNSKSSDFLNDSFYDVKWLEENLESHKENNLKPKKEQITYIFTCDYSYCLPLIELLNSEVVIVQSGTEFRELGENHYEVNLEDQSSIAQLWTTKNEKLDITLISLLSITCKQTKLKPSEKCISLINPHFNIVSLFSDKTKNKTTLNLLTQGSQQVIVADKVISVESSVLHGLGRLIVNELPNYEVRLIDFEGHSMYQVTSENWKTMVSKMNSISNPFDEFAIRKNLIYQKKMVKKNQEKKQRVFETVQFQDRSLKLKTTRFLSLDDLYFESVKRQEPKVNEVEILVDNTSINFKDYLKISNKIANNAIEGTFGEKSLGFDCVGTIVKCGTAVTKFKVGDKVLAFAPGTFQSYVTTTTELATKCPDALNHAESNVILSYITVIYCLRDKANLSKNDKVLIHNATGGVGLAAINYAKLVGAEIFATAGTTRKRDYLKSLGIKHIYNSRSLDFSKAILEETNGKGVDVVLSSLPGEILYQSFSTLAPYGTYLEIGKKDIIENVSMHMKFFNQNLSYIAVDVDRMLKEKQDKIADLLNDLSNYFMSGQLESLPTIVFPPSQIGEAFKLIEESKHVGKVVINFKDETVEIESVENEIIKNDVSYLITGGTRGLGLEISKWLVENGAKNLALVSRSGLKSTNAKNVVKEMKEKGVNVKVYSVDISALNQVAKMFDKMNDDLPKLAGIFHGAMVLDDGFLLEMNEGRFRKVLKPKVDGAMYLHQMSKTMNLDYFVVFSSISSLIGNIGQANYIAANAFLDSFAYFRKSQNLVATTVNLGVLAESGIVARSENLEKILGGIGINSFTNEQVMLGIHRILEEKPLQVGFFNLNWEVMSKNLGKSGLSLFSELIKNNANPSEKLNENQITNLDSIQSLKLSERQEFVVQLLITQLSKILKMSKNQISADKGINFLGIDSILAMELIRMVNDELAIDISPMEFLSGPSVNQLSTIIIEKVVHEHCLELV